MAIVTEKLALDNLNKEIRKIRNRTVEGMTAAATIIKLEAQRKTPVDVGNLKASTYIERGSKGNLKLVEVGYGQVGVGFPVDYAVYVHEDLEANHTTGEAKFLEKAINENEKKILSTIRKRARIR